MNTKNIRLLRLRLSFNTFIYYLTKTPIIKKKMNPYFISEYDKKVKYQNLIRIWQLIKSIAKAAIYLLMFSLLLPIIKELEIPFVSNYDDQYIYVCIILIFRFLKHTSWPLVTSEDSQKWMIIKSFKVSYEDYIKFEFTELIKKSLIFSVLFFLAMITLKIPFVYILIFSVMAFVFPFIANMIGAKVKIMQFINPDKKRKYRFLLEVSQLLLMVLFLSPLGPRIIKNPIFIILIALLSYYSNKAIKDFDYTYFSEEYYSAKNLSNSIMEAKIELQFDTSRMDDKADTSDSFDNVEKLHGYRLLNTVFLKRHRRLWLKPLKRRIAILGGITIILFALKGYLIVFNPNLNVYPFFNSLFGGVANYLIFIYFFTVGKSICDAYFKSCDRYLLNYAFYRERKVIWNQYLYRFFTIFMINLGLISLLSLVFLFVKYNLSTVSIQDWYETVFGLVASSTIFSVHSLFLYYILQPYNMDHDIKSVPYLIIEVLFSFLLYNGELFRRIPNPNITLTIVGILYFIISLVCVYFISEKTFNLKK